MSGDAGDDDGTDFANAKLKMGISSIIALLSPPKIDCRDKNESLSLSTKQAESSNLSYIIERQVLFFSRGLAGGDP